MGVEWGQLIPQTIAADQSGDYKITEQADGIELTQPVVEGKDSFDIKVQYAPFRIAMFSNS